MLQACSRSGETLDQSCLEDAQVCRATEFYALTGSRLLLLVRGLKRMARNLWFFRKWTCKCSARGNLYYTQRKESSGIYVPWSISPNLNEESVLRTGSTSTLDVPASLWHSWKGNVPYSRSTAQVTLKNVFFFFLYSWQSNNTHDVSAFTTWTTMCLFFSFSCT